MSSISPITCPAFQIPPSTSPCSSTCSAVLSRNTRAVLRGLGLALQRQAHRAQEDLHWQRLRDPRHELALPPLDDLVGKLVRELGPNKKAPAIAGASEFGRTTQIRTGDLYHVKVKRYTSRP